MRQLWLNTTITRRAYRTPWLSQQLSQHLSLLFTQVIHTRFSPFGTCGLAHNNYEHCPASHTPCGKCGHSSHWQCMCSSENYVYLPPEEKTIDQGTDANPGTTRDETEIRSKKVTNTHIPILIIKISHNKNTKTYKTNATTNQPSKPLAWIQTLTNTATQKSSHIPISPRKEPKRCTQSKGWHWYKRLCAISQSIQENVSLHHCCWANQA